MMKRFTDLCS